MTSAQRQRVVDVALTWQKTPYHHAARIKGVGVDCLTLLAEVYAEAGVIEPVAIPYYTKDFMLHQSEERYLEGLLAYTHEIQGPPQPGDIALWKFGRCYSHAAIVIKWPLIVHAYVGRSCQLEDAERAAWLTHVGENTSDNGKLRPRKFFSYWND